MALYAENSKTSGNATNGRTLKRMKLSFKNTSVKFAVNPEEYTQTEPNRATVTQTKGGFWIDAWGGGLREITIKGTTGVRGGGTNVDVGYKRWKKLRNLIRGVYDDVTDGETVKNLIAFYNFTDNEFFYCYPAQGGIELMRSKSRPHIYQYTIHLWVIRKIGEAVESSGVIGNPNKKSSTSKKNSSKTTKNTTITRKAGNGEAKTRNRSTDSQADEITSTNTRTKGILDIQEDCHTYYEALEPIIGGKAGKISPITGHKSVQGLTMQYIGTVSNVVAFTGADLVDDIEVNDISYRLLSETKFTSRISVDTYTMCQGIKEYSPEILSPAYSLIVGITPQQKVIQAVNTSEVYDSTLLELILDLNKKSLLSKDEVNHVKMVLLECMMVYRELYKIYNQTDTLSTTITMTNMEILINNLKALIMYFTLTPISETTRYAKMDISMELRVLEKIMTQVKTDVIDYL